MLRSDVTITPFTPSYTRDIQGVSVLVVDDIPLPKGFTPGPPPHLIQIGPHGWGGNHRHRRQEVYVGYGEGLVMIWRDANGERREAPMTSNDGMLQMVVMPSMVPHLVENRAAAPAILYELLDIDDGPAEPLLGTESLRQEIA